MRPLKLTLKGFTGIFTGQGRDEIAIDLEDLPSDARLVALCGPNGAGKSTVLDNLHPYRTMPSRAGGDPFGAFSYYEHVRLPENVKELEWEHAGRRYKSALVIRVNGKRKTEAYLHVRDGSRWVPVTLDDGTVSDGKSEVYDRCLEEIVGSPETFFTSVFSAQKRRPLSDYRNGEIKTLMTDLLGLNEVRHIGAKAADVAKQLRAGLAGRRAEASLLAARLQVAAGEGSKAAAYKKDLQEALDESARAERLLSEAQTSSAELQARAAITSQADGERGRLRDELQRCESELAAALRDLGGAQARDRSQLVAVKSLIEARRKARDMSLARARGQLETARQLVATAGAVERAAVRLPRVTALLNRSIQLSEKALNAADRAKRLTAELQSIDREIASIEREAGAAELKAADLRGRLGLTAEVPCAGTDLQDRCRLLTDAHAARPLIPSAEAQVGRLVALRAEALKRRLRAAEELEGLADAGARLTRAEVRVSRIRESQRQTELLCARAAEIERARESIRTAEATIREANAAPEAEPAEVATITALEEALAGCASRESKAQEQCESRSRALREALASIPTGPSEAALKAEAEKVDAARSRQTECQKAVARALEKHVKAQAAAAEAARMQSEAMQRAADERRIEVEVSLWTTLAKALSNDGVIALAIDEAGPALSRIANELLAACYGPRFSVSIRTQIEGAKGELREGFEVAVFDGQTGAEKSVAMMSGGESVWINEALTRAIALYLARVTARRFSTLFCDEVDGPLDPEHKRMFMAMKRKVLELGGYEREYFVSQTPELAAIADAVIDLGQKLEMEVA